MKFAAEFVIASALFVCFGISDALGVTHSVSFSAKDVTFGQERQFQTVSLAGCGLMGEIGRPQLPVKNVDLLIPPS